MLDLYDRKLTSHQQFYQKSIKGILGMDADSRLAPGALAYLWDGLMQCSKYWGSYG